MADLPFIPEYITVHLGAPDLYAENVTVTFPEYIKNVASSELFPTWPENALRANILAQISYALNRVYTEFYRSSGYDFDITNTTSYDQTFINGRDYFENISTIVDEIFNNYIVRRGNVEPLFASYCNGTTTTCEGLSQWGSVELAENGLIPYEILQTYYGENIDIVRNAPVENIIPSNPLNPLTIGSIGEDVRAVQLRLNRISKNYPAIPKISPVSGYYTDATAAAVRVFQEIFNLTPDGIVGDATWYRIQFVYNGVKRLNELASEGLLLDEVSSQYSDVLSLGSEGDYVRILQYFISVISDYYDTVPQLSVTGYYDEKTRDAVAAFQYMFGLTPDGIVGERTWDALHRAYTGILESLPADLISSAEAPFPGNYLSIGSTGDTVSQLQEYLNTIATVYPSVVPPPVTGIYSTQTEDAVREFQRLFDITVTGIVGPITWDTITDEYVLITEGNQRSEGQYAGQTAQESTGE